MLIRFPQTLPTGITDIQSMGKRIVVCDMQESVFFLKYKVSISYLL
jgi:hypothetical protein